MHAPFHQVIRLLADKARDYNALIVAWPELTRLVADQSKPVKETQRDLGV
jgi:hypothetical protein